MGHCSNFVLEVDNKEGKKKLYFWITFFVLRATNEYNYSTVKTKKADIEEKRQAAQHRLSISLEEITG